MSSAKEEDTEKTVDSLVELAAFVEGYDEHKCQAAEQHRRVREEQQLREMEDYAKAYEEEMARAAIDQEPWSPTPSSDYNEECEGAHQHSMFRNDANRRDTKLDYRNALLLENESKLMLIEAQGGFAEDQGYIDNREVIYDQVKEDEEDKD